MEDLISHNGTLAGSHNGIHAPSSVPVYSTQRQMRGIAIVGLGYWGPNWVKIFPRYRESNTWSVATSAVRDSITSKAVTLRSLLPNNLIACWPIH